MTLMSCKTLFLLYVCLSLSILSYKRFPRTFSSHSLDLTARSKRFWYSNGDHDTSSTDANNISVDKPKLKLGVLLLNLGGPQKTQDVEGFLYNLFVDPDIIRLPSFLSFLQKPIAYVIAKRRAPQSTAAYESIGGGSPIVMYTQAQADLIAAALCEKGFDAKCYFAMRYWNPYTEEVLDTMRADGINSIVIVPLYPQYSISTSGSSLKLLQEIFYQQSQIWGTDKVQHTVVPSWYYRQGYIRTMAELVLEEISHFTQEELDRDGLNILFSAHGVPESYILAGDPYKRQIEECVRLIAKDVSRLIGQGVLKDKILMNNSSSNNNEDDIISSSSSTSVFQPKMQFPSSSSSSSSSSKNGLLDDHSLLNGQIKYHLSFQSRVGPVQWLKPYTEDVLEEMGREGVKNMVVVPVSFVSEHVETLEEIDMEYRELALECGITKWRRVPAVNTDARFIKDMADLVVEALEAPVLSLAESTQNLDIMEDAQGTRSGLPKSLDGSGIVSGAGEGVGKALENLNGRFAMMGIIGTTLLELIAGHPVVQIASMR